MSKKKTDLEVFQEIVQDLTELVFGLDREDSKNFMDLYLHDSKHSDMFDSPVDEPRIPSTFHQHSHRMKRSIEKRMPEFLRYSKA